MSDIPCHLRDYRECDCGAGTCKAAPPEPTPAPYVGFSVWQILLISAALGISAYFGGGWAIGRMLDSNHHQQLDQQEASVKWTK